MILSAGATTSNNTNKTTNGCASGYYGDDCEKSCSKAHQVVNSAGTGCECTNGYHEDDGDCVENDCDGFNVGTCPTGDTCTTCQSGERSYYKITSCSVTGKVPNTDADSCVCDTANNYYDDTDNAGQCVLNRCHDVDCSEITGQTCNPDNGQCECSNSQKVYNNTQCVSVSSACGNLSSTSGTNGATGTYVLVNNVVTACQCVANATLSSGTCSCNTNYEDNENGECVLSEPSHNCPSGTTYDGNGNASQALETGHCICNSYNTNQCGLNYYCVFDTNVTNTSCGTGTCTEITGESTTTGGYTVSSGKMNWWSAYSFCKGLGDSHQLILLSTLDLMMFDPSLGVCYFPDSSGYDEAVELDGIEYACKNSKGVSMTHTNSDKSKWAKLKNSIGDDDYWVQDRQDSISHTLALSSGSIIIDGADYETDYALCE